MCSNSRSTFFIQNQDHASVVSDIQKMLLIKVSQMSEHAKEMLKLVETHIPPLLTLNA